MTQTQKIAGVVLFGYVFYTTARGNLPVWLEILGLR